MNDFVINEEFLQQLDTLHMLVKNNVAGMFGGNRKSRTFGSSCEFADYRDYIAGDDITKIDWNAYARFEKLYMKLYLDERQLHTKIYIDASRSMAYGEGKKAQMAIKLAAAFAYLSVREMDKVSVYAIRDGEIHEVISGMVGKDSFVSSIGKLNDMEFDSDSLISDAIVPSKVGYGDGVSVIISDFMTDNDYEQAIEHLVNKKRDVFCVQVLDREEINPQFRGRYHFFDSENVSREYRKNIDRDISAAYKAALEFVKSRIRDFCLARGAQYLLVSSSASLGEIFFGDLVGLEVVK